MPRKPRRLSSTGIYHIMTRGIDRMAIFHDDEDRGKYLAILANCLSGEQSGVRVEDGSFVPTSCDKETVPNCVQPASRPQPGDSLQLMPLPVDVTREQLWTFICADAPDIHPFTERVLDGEAEELLLQFSGLHDPLDVPRLPRQEQVSLFYRLQEEGVSIQQMARLTGIAKTNIARWLS